MTEQGEVRTLRRRVHHVLEAGLGHEPVATLVNLFLIVLIGLNVVVFAASTVPWIEEEFERSIWVFELLSVGVFSLEYALRLWSCVELPFLAGKKPWRARLQFALRPLQVIDLLAILPAVASLVLPHDLAALYVLRLFRFLKIARYSSALHSLGRVVSEERGALFGTLVIMLTLLLLSSTGMYSKKARSAWRRRSGLVSENLPLPSVLVAP